MSSVQKLKMDILGLIVLLLSLQTCSITTQHIRTIPAYQNYYNHPPSIPLPERVDWTSGLKEATYQALLRERIPDPRLKEHVYGARIDGLQNTAATPFGDVAIIARGQIYGTHYGFQFVQDPYQNDCDDCHNPVHCGEQCGANLENLVALWSVKRIRHRDAVTGHRYELQYTISPMSPAANPSFITRTGRFDYSIPGHVFIIKLNENNNNNQYARQNHNYNELKTLPLPYYPQQQQEQQRYYPTPNSILLNTGEYYGNKGSHPYNPGFLIGISPNGYKHIIHDIPPGLVDEIGTGVVKEPVKHYHHYYIPEVKDIDVNSRKTIKPVPITTTATTREQTQTTPTKTTFVPTIKQTTTTPQQYAFKQPQTTIPIAINPTTLFGPDLKYQSVTEPNYIETTYPKTTLVHVYTTIPETHPTTHSTQSTIFSPSPYFIQYSEPDPIYQNNEPTTSTTFKTLQPTVPTFVTVQEVTTPTYVTAEELVTTPAPIYKTTVGKKLTSTPTYVSLRETPTRVQVLQEATTPEKLTSTPTYVSLQEVPTRVQVLKETTTSKKLTSTPTYVSLQETPTRVQVLKEVTSIKPILVDEIKTRPDSINAQLPPPENGVDTTIPYVASTAITIISSPSSPAPSTTEEPKETETIIREQIYTTTEHVRETTTEITTITSEIPETKNMNEPKSVEDEIFNSAIRKPKKKLRNRTKVIYEEEFDIFGPTKTTTPTPEETSTSIMNKKPNLYDEIFNETKPILNPETSTNKYLINAIHSNARNNRTALRNERLTKYLKYKRNKPTRLSKLAALNPNTTNETKTSQSFITSISFEVNKNKRLEENGSIPITLSNNNNNVTELTTEEQTFDDVAQTLVNHARIATYLNSKSKKSRKQQDTNANR